MPVRFQHIQIIPKKQPRDVILRNDIAIKQKKVVIETKRSANRISAGTKRSQASALPESLGPRV
jgi:hypothetical protein